MLDTTRAKIYEVLEPETDGSRLSRVVDSALVLLIAMNVIVVIVETMRDFRTEYARWFDSFELISVVVFTAEYLLRLWSCTTRPEFSRPLGGRLRLALTPLLVVDLIAILPFYLPLVFDLDLRVVRAIRLVRLLRLMKLGRYSTSLRLLGRVVRQKKEELYIVLFVLVIMLVLLSSLVYYVEHEAQPVAFSSIPAAMWWGAVTLTTVGYGDVYPITPLGKFLGVFIALLGIGMFALPAGILSSGFVEALSDRESSNQICPHCGKDTCEPPE